MRLRAVAAHRGPHHGRPRPRGGQPSGIAASAVPPSAARSHWCASSELPRTACTQAPSVATPGYRSRSGRPWKPSSQPPTEPTRPRSRPAGRPRPGSGRPGRHRPRPQPAQARPPCCYAPRTSRPRAVQRRDPLRLISSSSRARRPGRGGDTGTTSRASAGRRRESTGRWPAGRRPDPGLKHRVAQRADIRLAPPSGAGRSASPTRGRRGLGADVVRHVAIVTGRNRAAPRGHCVVRCMRASGKDETGGPSLGPLDEVGAPRRHWGRLPHRQNPSPPAAEGERVGFDLEQAPVRTQPPDGISRASFAPERQDPTLGMCAASVSSDLERLTPWRRSARPGQKRTEPDRPRRTAS